MHLRKFFFTAFIVLSIIPLLNISLSANAIQIKRPNDLKKLYSVDMVESYFNRFLICLGISSNPNSVIIGNDGWFFLGDNYDNIITAYRNEKKEDSIAHTSRMIINSQLAWEDFFKANGVKNFNIIIGPNKSSVYSENLPNWAKTPDVSLSKWLYESDIYLNAIEKLTASKSLGPVYYSSDTHWNSHGAGIAFNNFIEHLKNKTSIIVPPKAWGEVLNTRPINGGDLARFLKVQQYIQDIHTETGIGQNKIEHTIYDFNSNEKVYVGHNSLYGGMNDRYLIETKEALNNSKVLWLSDSFGNALAPYMTATFSKVLKQHWRGLVGTKELEELIKEWKPDYVFYTVVERAALSDSFLKQPSLKSYINLDPAHMTTMKHPILHSVTSNKEDNFYVIGNDPYLVYRFPPLEPSDELLYLNFDLICDDFEGNIPIQIFWSSTKTNFSELDSIRFNARNGRNQVPLYSLMGGGDIDSLRIDLDGNVNCLKFTWDNVGLGRLSK